MKKIKFIILTSIILGILGCGQNPKEAAQYNDKIIKYQIEAFKSLEQVVEAFNDYVSNNDINTLKETIDKASKTIDSSIIKIEKIQQLENDTILKTSAIELLQTYKQVLDSRYRECFRIYQIPDKEYTDSDREEFIKNCDEANKILNEAHQKFIKAQKKFAEQFGLTLDTIY